MVFRKLALALAPLLLTALVSALVMEGYLNFGGGEKDVFLLVPLLLWSCAFLLSFLVLWWRRGTAGRGAALAAGVATGLVVLAWAALLLVATVKPPF